MKPENAGKPEQAGQDSQPSSSLSPFPSRAARSTFTATMDADLRELAKIHASALGLTFSGFVERAVREETNRGVVPDEVVEYIRGGRDGREQ